MDSNLDSLLKLIQVALDLSDDVQFTSDVDWRAVYDLAVLQGMGAIAFDGVQKLFEKGCDVVSPLFGDMHRELKYDWFGCSLGNEAQFEDQTMHIQELCNTLKNRGIKVMVIKGIGLSYYYPIPSHRAVGDIDMYLFGRGREADSLLTDVYGVTIKQNEDKHSTFKFKGTIIENHASFVNTVEYPSSLVLEEYLENEAHDSDVLMLGEAEFFVPSIMMNAVYLPCHTAGHFMYGGLTLKQLTDWALFVKRFGEVIDWEKVYDLSRLVGFERFLSSLNGIVIKYFGVSSNAIPSWERDYDLENRIWEEILLFKSEHDGTRFQRALRFLSSKWKFSIVYRESFYLTFLKRCWASIRGNYIPESRSVWD